MSAPRVDLPVLILAFNRPDKTLRLIETIRQLASPRAFYVAIDGPRASHPSDATLIAENQATVRRLLPAEQLHCLFREKNLGCRPAVSQAVSWFFSHVEEGIILEDDCLPEPGFFEFCAWGLQRYRSDPTVAQIGGFSAPGTFTPQPNSAYRTSFVHPWGWASWRRAWQHYNDCCLDGPRHERRAIIARGVTSPANRRLYDLLFTLAAQQKLNSWAFRWMFSAWEAGMGAIVPSQTLIRNVGFGDAATHTRESPTESGVRHERFVVPAATADALPEPAFSEAFHADFQHAHSAKRFWKTWLRVALPSSWGRVLRRFGG